MVSKKHIRNSTTEFLLFTSVEGANSLEVRVDDRSVWLSQKMIATLFDCSVDNVSLHLKNIFQEGELQMDSVTEESSTTVADGKNYK